MVNKQQVIKISLLFQFPNLIHGTSMRILGDMRKPGKINAFLKKLNIDTSKIISLKQIHSANIVTAEKCETYNKIYADGLVTEKQNIFLTVITADCVPIFFYEQKKKICGIVHAGWKGTLSKISVEMIKKIKNKGGEEKNIYVGIGPYIGSCCYKVGKDRADLFKKSFGVNSKILINKFGKWHVDIGKANIHSLIKHGILRKNIENSMFCTSCKSDSFFSFRKNKEEFGEMMSIIGIKH